MATASFLVVFSTGGKKKIVEGCVLIDLGCSLKHSFLGLSTIKNNGAFFWIDMDRIAPLECQSCQPVMTPPYCSACLLPIANLSRRSDKQAANLTSGGWANCFWHGLCLKRILGPIAVLVMVSNWNISCTVQSVSSILRELESQNKDSHKVNENLIFGS